MTHLLVTNDFPPKIGGIQSYLHELWRRLPPVLADDQALGTRLGASGRATYESRASEDVLGERWRQLLEEVLAAGPKKR